MIPVVAWDAITKYHGRGSLSSEDLFSHGSGGWEPKRSGLPDWSSSGENPLPGLQTAMF